MDPVAQTLAQQQSGSAQGQGFADFFVQGAQLAQGNRQLNLSERRLRLDEAQERRSALLFPLQQMAAQHQVINTGIEAAVNVQKANIITQSNAMLPQLLNLKMRFMQSPDGFTDEGLLREAAIMSQQNPWAFMEGPGKEVLMGIEGATAMRGRMVRLRQVDKELEAQGKTLMGFQEGPNSMSMQFGRDTQNLPNDVEIARYKTRLQGLIEQTSDPNAKRILQRELDNLNEQTLKSGMTIESLDPETGNVISRVTQGRTSSQAGGLTTASQTELQKKSLEADVAIRSLKDSISAIQSNPEAIGVLGIGRSAFERAQGQLMPRSEVDTTITETRHQVAKTFTDIAKSLRVDSGNMSRYELNQLERLGDFTGWENSPQEAIKNSQNLLNAVIARKLRYHRDLQQPIPDSLLLDINPKEIKKLSDDGLIPESAWLRWYRLRNQQTP